MKKVITTILTLIVTGAVLISGCILERKLNEYRTAEDIKTQRVKVIRKGRTVDFEKLKSVNNDVTGWIWLPGSNIDYPIVQGEDNDYYLHRDLDGSYLYDGCIFIDAAVEEPFSADENTVIYGHHMMSGAMFHDLSRFIREEDYIKEHGTFYIETEEGSYDLKVIAYCAELSDSIIYNTWFEPEEGPEEYGDGGEDSGALTKKEFIDFIRTRALKLSGESFDESDAFVTLSTCAYSSGDARHQVIGVMREADGSEKTVAEREDKQYVNKWFIFQLFTGAVMALSVIFAVASISRK